MPRLRDTAGRVHKTTIYRRWKDRESLVTDAMTDLAATQVPFPDTSDIDTDLRRLARSFVAFLNSPTGQAEAILRTHIPIKSCLSRSISTRGPRAPLKLPTSTSLPTCVPAWLRASHGAFSAPISGDVHHCRLNA